MSSPVEKIKEALTIADVIGSYIKLEKAGNNFRARCPFHNEKTPSFFVSPVRNTYHCFGCNQGGDIFSFVQEMEGVDFKGALHILAERAGIDLVRENPKERSERDRLYDLLEDCTRFYQRALTKNTSALGYLYGRGLVKSTLERFRVGFAPVGWTNVYDYAIEKGYSPEEVDRAGLVIRKNDPSAGARRYYDRFRSRIMFPIMNSSGRVVAFSGRIFGEHDEKTGKYINNSATPIYDKSAVLAGYDMAKHAIRSAGRCVVVEGYMDLLMSHQAGISETVAVTGTAFTHQHAERIKRLSDKIFFAFDGDAAGIAASEKSAYTALLIGLDVYAVLISEGKDPADIIAEDSEDWKKRIESALPIVDFYLNFFKTTYTDPDLFRRAVQKHVVPLIAYINNTIERDHYIVKTAHSIRVSPESVRAEVLKVSVSELDRGETRKIPTADIQSDSGNSRRDKIEQRIMGILVWQKGIKQKEFSVESYFKRFSELIGVAKWNYWQGDDSQAVRETVAFEAERLFEGGIHIREELDDLFIHLERELLKESLSRSTQEIRNAEMKDDTELVRRLTMRHQELSNQLEKISP